MATSKPYKEVKDRFLADPKFRKEYDALGPEFRLTPYSTDNTFHACYIRAIGGKHLVLDRTDPTNITFNFLLTPEQVKIADSYNTGGTVVAIALAESHKAIMRMIKNRTQPEDE